MAMMIRQDEAVEARGETRLAILKQCLGAAWETYDGAFRPLLPLCSPVGMANILRELVIQEVRERFVGIPGVDIRDRNVFGGRFLADIDQRLTLSFKKLSKDFLTTNNPTETSVAFDQQESIEGMPDLPRVTVGYQLSNYGTSMEGIWLAFVIGKECIWHHDLKSGASSIEFEFPREDQSAADKEREEAERREAERRMRAQGTDDASASDTKKPDEDPEVTDGG